MTNNPKPGSAQEIAREHQALADRMAELQREHDLLERQCPADIPDHEAHIAKLRAIRADLHQHKLRLATRL